MASIISIADTVQKLEQYHFIEKSSLIVYKCSEQTSLICNQQELIAERYLKN